MACAGPIGAKDRHTPCSPYPHHHAPRPSPGFLEGMMTTEDKKIESLRPLLVVNREQLGMGYLVLSPDKQTAWCEPYELIQKLPDGNYLVKEPIR
jgi:hypothetical protein